jgi:phage minor structural protein
LKPRLYNQTNGYLCTLSHATKVGYSHKLNDLHTAHFSLPIGDPKNAQCLTHNVVEIFAGNVSKGKYRILEEPECEITDKGEVITYNCEFVIAFLLDDVIDGYTEIGGHTFKTQQDLDWILDKQLTPRWVRDTCAFSREFQYKFEQTSLLDAYFSIPTCFDQDYRWTYDTTVYPWKSSLVQQETIPSCEIRRKVNMVYIKRSVDGSLLCTRLYPKGYGEGINQLTIADVNGGVAYLDADTQSKWGIKCSFFTDLRYEIADSLKARAQQILESVKNPYVTYTAKAVDLSRVTGLPWHTFDEGKCVRMFDDVSGLVVNSIITEFSQDDVDGDPLDCDITISNKTRDVASSLEELAKRTAISETYSQGATNIFCIPFLGSADPSHPKKVKIYIDESCRKINKLLIYWELTNFRANSTGAAYAGGYATTSNNGGGQTTTSSTDGGSTPTSSSGGGTTRTTSVSESGINASNAGTHLATGQPIVAGTDHYHTITVAQTNHTHVLNGHSHSVTLYDHTHTVTISPHAHTVTVNDHTHSISIPAHEHAIVYGIYEGGIASSVTMKVDGNDVPAASTTGTNELDIVQWLSKDGGGKIERGIWHTLEIIPDTLTDIEGCAYAQVFIQSVGGGDY